MQKVIWSNVKAMMEHSGITATTLSRAIGKSDNYVSQCIREDRNPTIDIVIKIAGYFKVEPFDLLKDDTARKWYKRHLEEKKAEIEKELSEYED